MWSSVEVNIGILCACLPVLQPVIQKLFGNVLGSSKNFKYAIHTSRGEHGTHIRAPASAASTAPFRRLDEDVISLPPNSAISDTWVSAGSHSEGNGTVVGETQAVPLNAIHVKRNVDVLNRLRS